MFHCSAPLLGSLLFHFPALIRDSVLHGSAVCEVPPFLGGEVSFYLWQPSCPPAGKIRCF